MSRTRTWFPLGGVARAHSLDDVQTQLIMDAERCMTELWPNDQRPPAHLSALHDCLCLLIDWTSRSDRGRARLRKRYLAIIDIMEQDLKGSNSNLLEQGEAFKVVPALLRSVIAADDKEEAAVDGGDIADAVELWLAAGDD